MHSAKIVVRSVDGERQRRELRSCRGARRSPCRRARTAARRPARRAPGTASAQDLAVVRRAEHRTESRPMHRARPSSSSLRSSPAAAGCGDDDAPLSPALHARARRDRRARCAARPARCGCADGTPLSALRRDARDATPSCRTSASRSRDAAEDLEARAPRRATRAALRARLPRRRGARAARRRPAASQAELVRRLERSAALDGADAATPAREAALAARAAPAGASERG